ncbi:MAG: hypothetical protein ACK50Q_15145 [Labrys sp. (in: a-proteobacteria)]|jgi:hypothetical protein
MLTTITIRQPREGDLDARAELAAQHHAYLEALRCHAGLLRDLDLTMRSIADALDETGLDAERRAKLTMALDAHIARARGAIGAIDRTLTVALGAGSPSRH